MTEAKLKELAKLLKVLSNAKRLRIFLCLFSGEKCVCDIYQCLDLPQNLASHHLGILQRSRLIVGRRQGKWIYYSLNKKFIRQTLKGFNTFTNKLTKNNC
ncbi:MAG: metalloregulator ArsR/SmtB family transcription factor [Patescibacteria group bacterium]|jgi:ArsR family transcriptional regulator